MIFEVSGGGRFHCVYSPYVGHLGKIAIGRLQLLTECWLMIIQFLE